MMSTSSRTAGLTCEDMDVSLTEMHQRFGFDELVHSLIGWRVADQNRNAGHCTRDCVWCDVSRPVQPRVSSHGLGFCTDQQLGFIPSSWRNSIQIKAGSNGAGTGSSDRRQDCDVRSGISLVVKCAFLNSHTIFGGASLSQ